MGADPIQDVQVPCVHHRPEGSPCGVGLKGREVIVDEEIRKSTSSISKSSVVFELFVELNP
jgi:hypothetical protein